MMKISLKVFTGNRNSEQSDLNSDGFGNNLRIHFRPSRIAYFISSAVVRSLSLASNLER